MILLALENAGIEVENKLQLGGTPILRDAITTGQVDIYPEYTGNAAFFFNEADSAIWKDAAEGASRAAELDLAANKIVWLSAAPASNTWAIAVRDDLAKANDLKSMSDLGRFIAAGGGQAGRRHRIRYCACSTAGLSVDLWLYPATGPDRAIVRRRHCRHHCRCCAANFGRQHGNGLWHGWRLAFGRSDGAGR